MNFFIRLKLVLLIVFFNELYGANTIFAEKMSIGVGLDKDKNIHPDIYLPFYNWSENFYSSVEYRTSKYIHNGTINSLNTFYQDNVINHKSLRLYIINYKFIREKYKFFIHLGLSKDEFETQSDGYILTNPSKTDVTNNINFTANSSIIQSGIVFKDTLGLDIRFGLTVFPTPKLIAKQNTKINSLSKLEITGESSKYSSTSYELNANFLYKTNYIFNFGFDVKYRFLPMEYDLKILQSNGDLENVSYNVKDKLETFIFKILWNRELFGFGYPTLSYKIENINATNNLDKKSYFYNQNSVFFGLETDF